MPAGRSSPPPPDFETGSLHIARAAHFFCKLQQLVGAKLGQGAQHLDDAIRQQVVRISNGTSAEDMGRIQRQLDVLSLLRRLPLLPHPAAFGHLQPPLKNGLRLVVHQQLRPELLKRALGKGSHVHFDTQCDFPLEVERGSTCGFVIRDAVIGLQHQRRRQQTRRHTRSSIVLAVQLGEINISEQLIPLAGQVAIERPLTNKLPVPRIRFEQSPLRRPLAEHSRPFDSIRGLPLVR